jgi:O-antigen ligase
VTAASAPLSVPADNTHRRKYLGIAVTASVVHMVMMIPGYSEDGDFQARDYAIIFAVSLVVGALVFLFVVPGGGATTALVLGIVAVASIVVFWAGITLPLAAAGAVTGWRVRKTGDRAQLATIAVALSALAAVALVAVIIGDAVAN